MRRRPRSALTTETTKRFSPPRTASGPRTQ
jgi:hypothetical protein